MLITNGKVFRNVAENQLSEYEAKGYKKAKAKKPEAEKKPEPEKKPEAEKKPEG